MRDSDILVSLSWPSVTPSELCCYCSGNEIKNWKPLIFLKCCPGDSTWAAQCLLWGNFITRSQTQNRSQSVFWQRENCNYAAADIHISAHATKSRAVVHSSFITITHKTEKTWELTPIHAFPSPAGSYWWFILIELCRLQLQFFQCLDSEV